MTRALLSLPDSFVGVERFIGKSILDASSMNFLKCNSYHAYINLL